MRMSGGEEDEEKKGKAEDQVVEECSEKGLAKN